MTGYVVVAQRYKHITKRDDNDRPLKWEFYHRGDLIELDADDRNTLRLLNAEAIVELSESVDVEEDDVDSPVVEPPPDVSGSTGAGGDSGTKDADVLKRPANAAPVDRWREFAAAKVNAEAPDDMDEQLAVIEDPDTERAFLIRTYGK